MSSAAKEAFEKNVEDVQRLLDIHEELTGDAAGRRHGVEVLNKSAIVLMSAVWEAYCEDLATEALEHLVVESAGPDGLPKLLRKHVARELKEAKNELALWDLANDGWRTVLKQRLKAIHERRNRRLNTPKTSNIGLLFEETVGLPNVPACWKWANVSAEKNARRLDRFVQLRGAIAHRSQASDSVKKKHASDFILLGQRLVGVTDAYVSAELAKVCGEPLY